MIIESPSSPHDGASFIDTAVEGNRRAPPPASASATVHLQPPSRHQFNNAPVSLYAKPQHAAERIESEYEHGEEERTTHASGGKQDALRLPTKPSTAPETPSYRLRQHGVVGNRSNNQREEDQQQETHGEQRAATAPTSSSSSSATAMQQQQPLAAFFAGKTAHRARRLSISAAHAAQVHANANSNNNGTGPGGAINPSAPGAANQNGNLVKPVVAIVKRKLQMESVVAHPYRTTTNAILAVPLRGKNNNLSAKLDAVVKSSPWMRRKVVLSDESKPGGRGGKQYSPRRGSTTTSSSASNSNNSSNSHTHNGGGDALPSTGGNGSHTNSNTSSNGGNKEIPHHELEKKVMAAFSRIVRMWRDRKRRNEAKTLTMMNGNKLRKDNGIQSAHVVGILSRRMIREVPALKFFDVEPETNVVSAAGGA
ncbi:hypothetical protein Gpo141_00008129, partial [Globisporangium polare]